VKVETELVVLPESFWTTTTLPAAIWWVGTAARAELDTPMMALAIIAIATDLDWSSFFFMMD
jgi:hypothetical protein